MGGKVHVRQLLTHTLTAILVFGFCYNLVNSGIAGYQETDEHTGIGGDTLNQIPQTKEELEQFVSINRSIHRIETNALQDGIVQINGSLDPVFGNNIFLEGYDIFQLLPNEFFSTITAYDLFKASEDSSSDLGIHNPLIDKFSIVDPKDTIYHLSNASASPLAVNYSANKFYDLAKTGLVNTRFLENQFYFVKFNAIANNPVNFYVDVNTVTSIDYWVIDPNGDIETRSINMDEPKNIPYLPYTNGTYILAISAGEETIINDFSVRTGYEFHNLVDSETIFFESDNSAIVFYKLPRSEGLLQKQLLSYSGSIVSGEGTLEVRFFNPRDGGWGYITNEITFSSDDLIVSIGINKQIQGSLTKAEVIPFVDSSILTSLPFESYIASSDQFKHTQTKDSIISLSGLGSAVFFNLVTHDPIIYDSASNDVYNHFNDYILFLPSGDYFVDVITFGGVEIRNIDPILINQSTFTLNSTLNTVQIFEIQLDSNAYLANITYDDMANNSVDMSFTEYNSLGYPVGVNNHNFEHYFNNIGTLWLFNNSNFNFQGNDRANKYLRIEQTGNTLYNDTSGTVVLSDDPQEISNFTITFSHYSDYLATINPSNEYVEYSFTPNTTTTGDIIGPGAYSSSTYSRTFNSSIDVAEIYLELDLTKIGGYVLNFSSNIQTSVKIKNEHITYASNIVINPDSLGNYINFAITNPTKLMLTLTMQNMGSNGDFSVEFTHVNPSKLDPPNIDFYPIQGPAPTDTVPPSLSSPLDIIYSEGSLGNKVIWLVSDRNPGSHNITQDTELIAIDVSWTNGSITLNIDGLSVGEYEFTIYLIDFFLNLVTDTVSVNVFDNNAPILLGSPLNAITLTNTSSSVTLEWTAFDLRPAEYTIYQNGSVWNNRENIPWNANETISITISNLDYGIYNITIIFLDQANNDVVDTVLVSVLDITTTSSNTDQSSERTSDGFNIPPAISIGIITLSVLGLSGGILRIRQRRKVNKAFDKLQTDFEASETTGEGKND